MENNSQRHTKKAHISWPRSILIDKEIRGVRNSRPISTTARITNKRTNERIYGYAIWWLAIAVRVGYKKNKSARSVLAEIRVRREIDDWETGNATSTSSRFAYRFTVFFTWSRCNRRDFRWLQFYQTATVGVSVTPTARGRSVGCSRKTRNRCAARVDIDLSVSVRCGRKKKGSWPASWRSPISPRSPRWCTVYSLRWAILPPPTSSNFLEKYLFRASFASNSHDSPPIEVKYQRFAPIHPEISRQIRCSTFTTCVIKIWYRNKLIAYFF